MSNITDTAKKNFEQKLVKNPYPGRGLVLGMDEGEKNMIQLYWIMGRSENSRNRVFEAEGTTVRTKPADPSKCMDPSLIIYNAMMEMDRIYIVTNGNQTDTIKETMEKISYLFSGIEMGSLDVKKQKNVGGFEKLRNTLAETIMGKKRGLTIIGPAKVIHKIEKNPEELRLFM